MKAAKIGVLILAPIILLAGLWWSLRGEGGPSLPKVKYVDVLEGEIVSLPKDASRALPIANDEGVRCIFPYYHHPKTGELHIDTRFRPEIERRFGDNPSLKIDLATMRIDIQE